jgi:hypothetical protein
MKKNILFLAMFALPAALFTSCEGFLDKNPLDQISSESFWKTEKDIEMGLTGVYSTLQTQAFNYYRMNWDALTDNAYQRHNHASIMNIAQGNVEPTSGGIINALYGQCYQGISACNIFLQKADLVTMDANKKSQYKGEVLFLRALFYFTLTEFYGGVPLYTAPVTAESASIKQSSKEEVVAQVLLDLDEAIKSLPPAPYEGHAVKGSAMALKAKVLMHNAKWQEAAAVANELIQAKVFSLYPNYPDLFLKAGQTGNPEIIFSTRYLNPNDFATNYGPDVEFGWWNSLQPMENLANAYECTDGLPIGQSPLYNPNAPKANRDPRFDYTIRLTTEPVVRSDGFKWSDWEGSFTGYIVKKHIEPNNVPIDYSVRSEQDFVLMRYAEVLLIYAESRNEMSGPDPSVYDAVNAVRARVNMPPLPQGLDQAAMRNRIRQERRVEFGMEGLRYQDLKRWKMAETVIPTIVDPGGTQRKFDPAKHYLFPFPQSETDINENLVQNTGY